MTRHKLRISTIFLLLLCVGAAFAQTPARIPVTGHFGGVGTDTPNNFGVKFELQYCGSNLPRVFGVFNPVLTNTVMVVDPTTGLISGQIWPNDVLNCGGTLGGTRYNVTALVNNIPQGQPVCYQVLSTVGTFNLDTAQPCTQVPPPPPPPGFGDYEFNNLTLAGFLQGTSANFTGDVTALSFHFSTTGVHFACPSGQFATALNQDLSFGCAAPSFTAPVASVFGRTGAVTAQSADYSFSLIGGLLGFTQTAATGGVYQGTFNKAQLWDHTPSGCAGATGQAIKSITNSTSGALSCTGIAVPTSFAQGITITTACSGGSTSNCICTPGTSTSFDYCTVNLGFTTPFPTALDGATGDCLAAPLGSDPSTNGAALCHVVGGNTSGVTVQIQNVRSIAANVTQLTVTAVGH